MYSLRNKKNISELSLITLIICLSSKGATIRASEEGIMFQQSRYVPLTYACSSAVCFFCLFQKF